MAPSSLSLPYLPMDMYIESYIAQQCRRRYGRNVLERLPSGEKQWTLRCFGVTSHFRVQPGKLQATGFQCRQSMSRHQACWEPNDIQPHPAWCKEPRWKFCKSLLNSGPQRMLINTEDGQQPEVRTRIESFDGSQRKTSGCWIRQPSFSRCHSSASTVQVGHWGEEKVGQHSSVLDTEA